MLQSSHSSITSPYPARWWETGDDGKILCTLCPRFCRIGEGKPGFCYIRQNIDGQLVSLGYGHPTGFAADPIEKKPLSHFLPGTQVLSFGTAGCNLGCKFCQNWDMSKARSSDRMSKTAMPEQVVSLAQQYDCASIAYTYNDPTIFGEYVIDIARIAKQHDVRNVMVTAGYITPEARREIYADIDAANVDLKAFTDDFYYRLSAAHLDPVLDTLLWLKRETDVWFEITTLLIPGENDSTEEIRRMTGWVLENLGSDVPLHFTAFHPDYRMLNKPATPTGTLDTARHIALKAGVRYVYVGNVHDTEGQTTWCPECGEAVVQRNWHSVLANHLQQGCCGHCGTTIAGRF